MSLLKRLEAHPIPEAKRLPSLLTPEQLALRRAEKESEALGDLEIFSPEILMAIVEFLSFKDRLTLRQTCRRLRDIVREARLPYFRSVESPIPLRTVARCHVFSYFEHLAACQVRQNLNELFSLPEHVRGRVRSLQMVVEETTWIKVSDWPLFITDLLYNQSSTLEIATFAPFIMAASQTIEKKCRDHSFENVTSVEIILRRPRPRKPIINLQGFLSLCPKATTIKISGGSESLHPSLRHLSDSLRLQYRVLPLERCPCGGSSARKLESLEYMGTKATQLPCDLHPDNLTTFFYLPPLALWLTISGAHATSEPEGLNEAGGLVQGLAIDQVAP